MAESINPEMCVIRFRGVSTAEKEPLLESFR